MTNFANRTVAALVGATFAVLLALSPTAAVAQDGQFDLRTRTGPTPAPTSEPRVVGPVDPDTPTVRARPRASPEIVLPPSSALPSPAPSIAVEATVPSAASPRTESTRAAFPAVGVPRTAASGQARPAVDASLPLPVQPAASPTASASSAAAPGAYQARDLDVVSTSPRIGLWLGLATLVLLVLGLGWLAWSRHFRHRARALLTPVVERPRGASPAHPATPAAPEPPVITASGALHLALQATRMSATLVNTTLSYRLAVTNRGLEPLHDVRIAGDMIAAHASRSASEQLGPVGATFPELHRIATLAPGESVTLGGDIRLPLVSIIPIRNGDAALFVPLARLRGQGQNPAGETVAGGGTFLVGQEPGLAGQAPSAGKRLQPFRLDLGPRNYSRLGQQLLPAA